MQNSKRPKTRKVGKSRRKYQKEDVSMRKGRVCDVNNDARRDTEVQKTAIEGAWNCESGRGDNRVEWRILQNRKTGKNCESSQTLKISFSSKQRTFEEKMRRKTSRQPVGDVAESVVRYCERNRHSRHLHDKKQTPTP